MPVDYPRSLRGTIPDVAKGFRLEASVMEAFHATLDRSALAIFASLALQNRCVLLVADEYLLADELRGVLEDAGAVVIGPAGSLADATAMIMQAPRIDGAILDANLGGEMGFP